MLEAAAAVRQESYAWLFKTGSKAKQDKRIRILLEEEAFERIHEAWRRLGYPFDRLVPSYATAIGSSADRPEALAELVGILLNDGVWQPTVRVEQPAFRRGHALRDRARRRTPAGRPPCSPRRSRAWCARRWSTWSRPARRPGCAAPSATTTACRSRSAPRPAPAITAASRSARAAG